MQRKHRFKDMRLKEKLILTFSVLVIISSAGISFASMAVFQTVYKEKSRQYIMDITRQTTNNLENNIDEIETITFNTLKNTKIQEQLGIVNTKTLSEYEKLLVKRSVEEELIGDALYNKNVTSLSVISLTEEAFTVQKQVGEQVIQMFSGNEVFDAKGSTLWKLTDDGQNGICIERAIYDFKTQRPIGIIDLVCEEAYFSDILEDISNTYTSGTYIVDTDGIVVASNNRKHVGSYFPVELERLQNIQNDSRAEINEVDSYLYTGEKMPNGWMLVTTVAVGEIQKDIRYFALFSGGIALLAIVVAVVAIILMIRHITFPLGQLSKSMTAVGQGDFSGRVHIAGNDEIGSLGRTYNDMAKNIETLIEKVYKMEISQKQAEIEFLKMQINPHFLYNTLDTISWMARSGGNNDISDMAVTLADLLRATIKQDSFITIDEELKSVRNYLFIQEYRFGDKVEASYQIDNLTRDYIIPNFILQPLVENAIIHGLEPKLGKGNLNIEIRMQEQGIFFCVSDDGVGMTPEEVRRTYEQCERDDGRESIGIKNVYRRLKIYYGAEGTLKIESAKDEGTKITFCLSLKKLNEQLENEI
ncbi:cache domain-containing sensor histidine kinase [Robinsoniella peoriensis]|uniref:cache domain-containing sensor histidine kinase n=1 Tax=Robinsoniella peoriensis TaxID=180332 RepID=UPI00159F2952|nr:sensor histidine kinase [Robinsoniella peoriensis]